MENMLDEFVLEISQRLDLASTFSFSLASKRHRSLLKSFDINVYKFAEICAENTYEDLLLWAHSMGCPIPSSVPDLLAVSGGPKSLDIISKCFEKTVGYISLDVFYKMLYNGNKTLFLVEDSMLADPKDSPLLQPLRLAERAAIGGQFEMANLLFERYLKSGTLHYQIPEARKRLFDAFGRRGTPQGLLRYCKDPSSGLNPEEIASTFQYSLGLFSVDGIKLGIAAGRRPSDAQIKNFLADGFSVECLVACDVSDDKLRELASSHKKDVLKQGNYDFIKYLVERKALESVTRGDIEGCLMDNERFMWGHASSRSQSDVTRFEALKYLTDVFQIEWKDFDFYLSRHGWVDENSFSRLISRGVVVADNRLELASVFLKGKYNPDRFFSLMKPWIKMYYSSRAHPSDKVQTTFSAIRLMNAEVFALCINQCEVHGIDLAIPTRNISEFLHSILSQYEIQLVISAMIKNLRLLLEKGAQWDDESMQKYYTTDRTERMLYYYRAQLDQLRAEFMK